MRLRTANDHSAPGAAGQIARGLKAMGKTKEEVKNIMKDKNEDSKDKETRPAGLPKCIPASAASIFFGSSPEIQRKLIRDASQCAAVRRKRNTYLASAVQKRKGEMLCFCKELKRCPLQAAEDPADDPTFDGLTTQVYPSDDGWWRVRDIVLELAKISDTKVDALE